MKHTKTTPSFVISYFRITLVLFGPTETVTRLSPSNVVTF